LDGVRGAFAVIEEVLILGFETRVPVSLVRIPFIAVLISFTQANSFLLAHRLALYWADDMPLSLESAVVGNCPSLDIGLDVSILLTG
jgi:hypothetical protein